MTIYRNTNWTRRNYECTNVVFQIVPEGQTPKRFSGAEPPPGEWVKADSIPADMQNIGGIWRGPEFYGYL